ncbi:MAG TPA: rhodanese-like domain-containing protein [Archangium sp.]|uniref:rhodanese-like domain-containing protein n=1 Tax=Archangium sp. TaxID=1872627 RepID=UPI002E319CD3|nr:rhodanese-like domain-containing protein [Archangium sp.]HEX5750695.1 rhodanese-like domain-containing protein [Archangium sp.]
MPIPEIDPATLAQQLSGPPESRPVLLDVRFPQEHAYVAFPGSVLIPLPELEERTEELEAFRGRRIVVYCHHGVRSLDGAAWLLSRGLDAVSLRGGIDLYSRAVDPSLPRY